VKVEVGLPEPEKGNNLWGQKKRKWGGAWTKKGGWETDRQGVRLRDENSLLRANNKGSLEVAMTCW